MSNTPKEQLNENVSMVGCVADDGGMRTMSDIVDEFRAKYPLYNWYVDGWDFVAKRWNQIVLEDEAWLDDLPKVLDALYHLRSRAWDYEANDEPMNIFPQP